MKDNQIEVTSLSDLLRFIELKVKNSGVFKDADNEKAFIGDLHHTAKQGFDLGKNGKTYFEIGE